MNLEKTRDKVIKILEKFPESRNDDDLLFLLYVKTYHEDYEFNGFINWSSLAKITKCLYSKLERARRKIQNQERLYPPTIEKIAIKRGWKQLEWQKALGYYIEEGQTLMVF